MLSIVVRNFSFASLMSLIITASAPRPNFLSEGCRVQHSAKMPSMGSTMTYIPLTAFFVRGRNRPLITTNYRFVLYAALYEPRAIFCNLFLIRFLRIGARWSVNTTPSMWSYSCWITRAGLPVNSSSCSTKFSSR